MAANSNATSILGVKITGVTGDPSSNLVYSNGPTLVAPILGAATATSLNKLIVTAPATSATLTIANLKTLTVSNTLTLTGTDGSSVNFGTGGTVVYTGVTTLSSLVSVGTIATGTWNATPISTAKGGVPSGGLTGQFLRKNTNTSYDYSWATVSGSGTVTSVSGVTNRTTITGTPTINPTVDIAATYAGQGSITTVGIITSGTWSATTIAPTRGGTGLTAYTTGDILYASGTNVLSRLPIGPAGTVLTSNGLTVSWVAGGGGGGSVTSVSGTAGRITVATGTTTPVINIDPAYVGQSSITTLGTITTGTWSATAISPVRGGTGLTTFASGSLLRATALNVWAALAPGLNGQVLTMVGGLPAWSTISGTGTVTSVNASGGTTGLTFTGGPITSSGTLTLSGTLGVPNGGTGLTTTTQGDIFYGGIGNTIAKLAKNVSATRYLSNQGSANDPAWAQVNLANGVTGTLPLANVASGLARSVLGVAGNVAAANASIQGTANQILRVDSGGTTLGFGSINLAQAATVGTSILGVSNGGTGLGTLTSARVIVTTSSNSYAQVLPTGTNGISLTMGSGSMVINYAFNPTRQPLVDTSGTITLNVTNGEEGRSLLTNVGRTVVISNPVAGRTYVLELQQDGSGARTVTTWPAGTLWEGGATPNLATRTANKIDLFTFYYNGTNFLAKNVGTFN